LALLKVGKVVWTFCRFSGASSFRGTMVVLSLLLHLGKHAQEEHNQPFTLHAHAVLFAVFFT
jgi:hypothetical protein